MKKTSAFNRFANAAARATGRPIAFILAGLTIAVWAITGPLFGFSDTWQLVINTGTTIVTFLMVFLIQNTQNRDTAALQIKLDELIRAVEGAHTVLLDLEALEDDELDLIKKRYWEIARRSREAVEKGQGDTGTPFVHCVFEADQRAAAADQREPERK
jgi:low affinity Fe/Cu permease